MAVQEVNDQRAKTTVYEREASVENEGLVFKHWLV